MQYRHREQDGPKDANCISGHVRCPLAAGCQTWLVAGKVYGTWPFLGLSSEGLVPGLTGSTSSVRWKPAETGTEIFQV
jgi:hypothetical protein